MFIKTCSVAPPVYSATRSLFDDKLCLRAIKLIHIQHKYYTEFCSQYVIIAPISRVQLLPICWYKKKRMVKFRNKV